MEMTVQEFLDRVQELIKSGRLKPDASIVTHEGYIIVESNIVVLEDGKTLAI